MKLSNSMINKTKFIKDTFENKNVTDVISRDVKEFSAKMHNSKPLEPLDEDIIELSDKEIEELKESSVSAEDFDDFFKMSELAERGKQPELYDELQYSIDDIPLADSVNPNKKIFLDTQMYTHNIDTDLDSDTVLKLKLMNYYDIVSSRSGEYAEHNAIAEMAYKAANLEETHPKGKIYEYIDKSILKRKGGPNYPSSDLLEFIVKRPAYRKHVVETDRNGNETYNRCFGSHFDKLLDETKDVKTIKRVLSASSLRLGVDGKYSDWQFADFGVKLFRKNKIWSENEETLMNSLKETCVDTKNGGLVYERVNKSKLQKADKLLGQDIAVEDIIKEISDERIIEQ